jgi:putative ABC transport system ATP-binding protein
MQPSSQVSPSVLPLALDVRDLRFRFGSRAADQEEIPFELAIPAFSVPSGGQVLLTGGSGTGKSTLLQLIAGLLDPTAGSVAIAGTPIHGLRGAARDRFRGRSIGMIFQTFQLALGFSALENVMLALLFAEPRHEVAPRGHEARAKELLAHLGIERIDAPVETFSVGQQQRVAVARALACRPPLVLADEPTASLDPHNATVAIELIRSTCREEGSALVCVSHDPSLIPHFEHHVDLSSIAYVTPRTRSAAAAAHGGER